MNPLITPLPADVAATQPVVQTKRIPSIDILRGVALLGLLLVTIPVFGLTEASLDQLVRGPHGGNYWLQTIIRVLFENKMRALFSMLFGAGVILFLAKNRDGSGMAAPELFIRRQMWLIMFGLLCLA